LKDEVGQASNDIYDMKEDRREIKETLYREMDRDYRDMKSYVKRSIQKHRKQEQQQPQPEQNTASDAIQMIVNEYDNHDNNAESSKTEQGKGQGQEREYENHHIIIIDANTVFSDDE
jgi:hypothetical protein